MDEPVRNHLFTVLIGGDEVRLMRVEGLAQHRDAFYGTAKLTQVMYPGRKRPLLEWLETGVKQDVVIAVGGLLVVFTLHGCEPVRLEYSPLDAGDGTKSSVLTETDRKSTRLNSSHRALSRMPSSA